MTAGLTDTHAQACVSIFYHFIRTPVIKCPISFRDSGTVAKPHCAAQNIESKDLLYSMLLFIVMR